MVIALDRQIETLNIELDELNAQVRDLPTTQQEVLRLVRDVEVNTVLYTSLLNTAQELRVVKAGTVGNVRVVDSAVLPYRPIKPRKAMVLLLSLLLGGFAGVAIAFVRKALNAGVGNPDLIEQHVNRFIKFHTLHNLTSGIKKHVTNLFLTGNLEIYGLKRLFDQDIFLFSAPIHKMYFKVNWHFKQTSQAVYFLDLFYRKSTKSSIL